MGWVFGVTELDGTPIGRLHWAVEKKLTIPLNGLPTASFRLRLDDPMADEIISRDGDCLLKIYHPDSSLTFIGDLMDGEEVGTSGFYRRVFDRKGLLNQGYSLPSGFPTETDVRSASDFTSIDARTLMQEVVPADVQDSQLRQALVDAHVQVRAIPRIVITFDPSAREETDGTLAVNAAGPLWRLSKRLIGVPYPDGVSSYTDVDTDKIIMGESSSLLDQTNLTHHSGIQEGTADTLYPNTVGTDPSWAFKPVSEALTEMQASKVPYPVYDPPAALLLGQDDFSSANATLSGTTPDVGTAWSERSQTGASSTGFSVTTSPGSLTVAKRSVNNDSGAGVARFATIGMSDHVNTVVGVSWAHSYASNITTEPLYFGVQAREDTTNDEWIRAGVSYDTTPAQGAWIVQKRVSGSITQLATVSLAAGGYFDTSMHSMALLVDEFGNWSFWHWADSAGFDPAVVAYGQDDDLATGGALATGKAGIWDSYSNTLGAIDRYYDDFYVADYTGPQSFDFELEPIEPTGTPTMIANLNVAYQIGTSKPEVIFEPGRSPQFGTDYIVGDYVTGRAKTGTTAKFNALFRVYGVDVVIDENGREAVVPTLVPA